MATDLARSTCATCTQRLDAAEAEKIQADDAYQQAVQDLGTANVGVRREQCSEEVKTLTDAHAMATELRVKYLEKYATWLEAYDRAFACLSAYGIAKVTH